MGPAVPALASIGLKEDVVESGIVPPTFNRQCLETTGVVVLEDEPSYCGEQGAGSRETNKHSGTGLGRRRLLKHTG